MKGLHVGLDFGTSNSGIAYFDGSQMHLLPLDPQNVVPEVVKSILYITRDYQAFVGQAAIELYYRQNVNRQRRYVKKWAGEIEFQGAELFFVRDSYVDVDELKPGRLLQYLKTSLRKGKSDAAYQGTQVFERYYSLTNLLQTFLSELKTRGEALLGTPITGVTLGRPVYFSDDPDLDRQAEDTLRQAAFAAGFDEVHFELEPVAAARYYAQSLDNPRNVLVFDFGGGTLDIAILRLGVNQEPIVYASGGIGIAGSDFDQAIIRQRLLPYFGQGRVNSRPELKELVAAVPEWSLLPELSTPRNRHILEKAISAGTAPVQLKALLTLIYQNLAFSFYNRVETAKISLSSSGAAVIAFEEPGIDVWELYTRTQFEADIADYRQKIEETLLMTIASSGFEPDQIDAVVKTGGSSSIPRFTRMLEEIFGVEKVVQTNTFSSVAAGLAISASQYNRR
jgi:hypothetical chaperone protein